MKKLLTKNIGLKITSLFLAVLVWMVVVNISNPEIKASKQVQVEVENENVILDAGKTYEFTGSTMVTVSYAVRTRDEYKIKASDFRAYVDMKDLYDVTGSVPVNVEVLNNKEIIIDPTVKPSVMRLKVEDVIKTTKDIEYELEGNPQDGYAVGRIELNPSSISISGPASQVSQIKTVKIIIDVDGINEDMRGTAIPLFVDSVGRTIDIDSTDIVINHTSVNYTLTTLIGKAVPVEYSVSGSPAPGYSYVGVEGTIKEVVLQGSKAELADINSISVPPEVLDLGGTNHNKQVEVDLSKYVPGSLKIVGDTVSTITMKIEGQEEKHFSINSSQIAVNNAVEGLEYLVEPITIGVVLGGIKSDLDALDARSILGSIDVADILEAGTYPVEITFSLPAGYVVKSYSPVTVKITGKPVEKHPGDTEADEDELYIEDELDAGTEAGTETETETEIEAGSKTEAESKTETTKDNTEEETIIPEISSEN